MILKISDRIRTTKVDFFNQFALSLRYDSVGSTFSFNFYFNPENKKQVDMACLGHNHIVTLEHNGELLLTGTILPATFTDAPVKQLVAFGGYSLPGVLEDCNIPPTLYPLQSDGLSLKQIAEKLCAPFKIKVAVDPAVAKKVNSTYKTSTADEKQTVKDYLTELATQKNVIISHNEKGHLLFTEAKKDKKPIAHFYRAMPNTEMKHSFNAQGMHSHITVMKEADQDGGNAGEYTIKNPYVPFTYRPKVIVQSSGDDNDTVEVAKNALAAELKNIKLTINTDRWEIDGKIIKPNNYITVENHELYMFRKITWFIESVDFVGDNKSTTATLNCVLPEVYNGEMPEYLFKGINLH